jgi:hypothetical protein
MKRIALAAAACLVLAAGTAQALGHLAVVTITDRTSGRTLPVFWHDGQAWVAGTPGHEYLVTVRNREGQDLLAVASVDGVNVITGQAARASQDGYVVPAWERLDIKGWRKSVGEVASFYFTSLGDSYAARTGRPDDVGVIGVALFERARPLPPPVADVAPPADAPWRSQDLDAKRERTQPNAITAPARTAPPAAASAQAAPSPAPGEPLGTGHGRRESSRVRYVDFVRATSEPVETLAIRYDSYANLVAMGVIPSDGRRDPQPFPGHFVPDPR